MPDGWAFLREIRDGWPAVRAAKWVVIAGIGLGSIVGFLVATYWSSGTISILRERLAQAQERLAASPLATTFNIAEVTEGDIYIVKPTDDLVLVNKTIGSPTIIRLPSGFTVGKRIVVKDKKGDSNKNHITIIAEGGPIDSLPHIEMQTNYGAYSFVWNGRGWTWF